MWAIDIDRGLEAARQTIVASLHAHVAQLMPRAGYQQRTPEQRVGQYKTVVLTYFNAVRDGSELQGMNLTQRRKWLAAEERGSLKTSIKTSQRDFEHAITEIERKLAGSNELRKQRNLFLDWISHLYRQLRTAISTHPWIGTTTLAAVVIGLLGLALIIRSFDGETEVGNYPNALVYVDGDTPPEVLQIAEGTRFAWPVIFESPPLTIQSNFQPSDSSITSNRFEALLAYVPSLQDVCTTGLRVDWSFLADGDTLANGTLTEAAPATQISVETSSDVRSLTFIANVTNECPFTYAELTLDGPKLFSNA